LHRGPKPASGPGLKPMGQNIAADKKVQKRYEHEMEYPRLNSDRRTPLNGILGFTGIAMRENGPIKKQEYLQKIQPSVKQYNRDLTSYCTKHRLFDLIMLQ